MIKGIGIDMTEIARIEKACKKESFLNRVYTKEEIKCFSKSPVRLAGNFAVKEAVSKVFGTGFSKFLPGEIEVLRDDLGKPYVNLYGEAEKMRILFGISTIFISITNEKGFACAVAVGEG